MQASGENKREPHYWLVIPAAGSGQRFGAPLPKQFVYLAGKLIAQHSLERLLSVSEVECLMVVCDKQNAAWNDVSALAESRIKTTSGGASRAESVLNGLLALPNPADEDWVLVHDIARPCITLADINKLICALTDHPVGGILATPISDTLKRVVTANEIYSTEDRSQFWGALTPQMFRYGLLKKALQASLQRGSAPTDEAAAVESLGFTPLVIEGRRDNIKVTRPEDLAIAEAIHRYQQLDS